MENIHLDLSEHEMDVMLNALEIAIENADEYEAGETRRFFLMFRGSLTKNMTLV